MVSMAKLGLAMAPTLSLKVPINFGFAVNIFPFYLLVLVQALAKQGI